MWTFFLFLFLGNRVIVNSLLIQRFGKWLWEQYLVYVLNDKIECHFDQQKQVMDRMNVCFGLLFLFYFTFFIMCDDPSTPSFIRSWSIGIEIVGCISNFNLRNYVFSCCIENEFNNLMICLASTVEDVLVDPAKKKKKTRESLCSWDCFYITLN